MFFKIFFPINFLLSHEMLSQIMREVADDAKRTNEEASKKYFDELRNEANRQQAEWADRINEVRNGNF